MEESPSINLEVVVIIFVIVIVVLYKSQNPCDRETHSNSCIQTLCDKTIEIIYFQIYARNLFNVTQFRLANLESTYPTQEPLQR